MARSDPIPSSAGLHWRMFRERWLPLVTYAGALAAAAALWHHRLGIRPVDRPGTEVPPLVATHPAHSP